MWMCLVLDLPKQDEASQNVCSYPLVVNRRKSHVCVELLPLAHTCLCIGCISRGPLFSAICCIISQLHMKFFPVLILQTLL